MRDTISEGAADFMAFRLTPVSPQVKESFASSPGVRSRMQLQKEKDTRPEVELRKELFVLGLRYRLHRRVVPGTARTVDIVFGPARVAVFVDGCFWHGCPQHSAQIPKSNTEFWTEKIAQTRRRDRDTERRLHERSWTVVRVWEHEDAKHAASKIAKILRGQLPEQELFTRRTRGAGSQSVDVN